MDTDEIIELQEACESGSLEKVLRILSKEGNADLLNKERANNKYPFQLSLKIAAKRGHVAICESLLKAGADVNAKSGFARNTALHDSAKSGRLDVCDALLRAGALLESEDGQKRTPLFMAVLNGSESVCSWFVERGAQLEKRDIAGCTPLLFSIKEKKPDSLDFLISKGAALDVVDSQGQNVLHHAASIDGGICEKILQFKAVPIDTPGGKYNDSALQMACAAGQSKAVVLLIEAGANIEYKNEMGYTPLISACERRREDVVFELLRQGANIEARSNSGEDALMAACEIGNLKIALMLMDGRSNIPLRSIELNNALHSAVNSGDIELCMELMRRGADAGSKVNGETAWGLAARQQNKYLSKQIKAFHEAQQAVSEIDRVLMQAGQRPSSVS